MTRFDTDGVADLLYAASDDAPPSRVSLDGVLTDGRRRRRIRAVAVPLFAAAAIAALAAAGMVAANLRPTGLEPPPGATTPATTPVPTTAVVPTQFPLDRVRFSVDAFGEPRYVRLSARAQYLGYGGPSVWAFLPGADEARQTVEQEYTRAAAPPVNGLAASHLYQDDGSGPQLRGISFQWAPAAWADIIAGGTTTEAHLAELAGSLRTDVDEPVRFWFTVSPPAGLRLAAAEPSNDGEEANWSTLFFVLGDGWVPQWPAANAAGVEVTVGDYFDGPAQPTVNLRGRPAIVSNVDEYYSVELVENDGFTVRSVKVTIWGSARGHFSTQQAEDLAFSVVLLGTWDDRSQWTEDPIR